MSNNSKYNVCVLVSCMFEDKSIIERLNIQSDVVVVNQCDVESVEDLFFYNKDGIKCKAIFISTTERGLSRSRNMAIKNAKNADICLICDDDELLDDDYPHKIEQSYRNFPDTSIITFIVDYNKKLYPSNPKELGIIDICRTSSVQISFLRKQIIENGIEYDIMMGSGSGNGAGEENKFLMDCRNNKLKMMFNPIHIGKILSNNSVWNNGYTEKFFRDRGWSSRRSLGTLWGYLFILYNAFHHRKKYIKDGMSFICVLQYMHKGFFEKR